MDVTQYQLDNGLQVILQSRKSAPVVACNVWVGVGSADEEPHEAGLAHVHEHMLFKGTKKRGVGEIAREVEAAGGHINAFTSFDQTCYYVVMSSRFTERGVDILSDAIRNSNFDAEELGRELEVIQEEIKRGNDHPQRVASQMLFDTAYEAHPYKLPVIGSKESVDSFTREHVVNFFNKHYRPSNSTVVLVGDFEIEEGKALIDKYFGDWEAGSYSTIVRTTEPVQRAARAKVDQRDIQENHLRMAFHVPDVKHEDIPALDVLSAVMGYGDASVLHQRIHREQELANAVYCMAYTPKDPGILLVGADYQLEENTHSHESIAQAVLTEVFRFREHRVGEDDIRRARTLIESQEIYSQQTAEGLAMKLGRNWITTADATFDERYYAAIAALTPEAIQEVAKRYLTLDNLTLTLLRSNHSEAATPTSLIKAAERAFEDVRVHAIDGGIALDSDGFAVIRFEDGPVLVVQEDHTVPTFAMRAMTLGGVRYETRENNGINSLLSEMIMRGTHRRDAVDLAREIESMAAGIGGIAGRNSFGASLTGLSRYFERTFDIFADVLNNSTLPADEFEREKALQIQGIKSRRDSLAAVNYDLFAREFFGDYPYGMTTDGTEESVAGLTPEAARSYLQKLVKPSGLVITAVGDVSVKQVASMIEDAFCGQHAGESWDPVVPARHRHMEPRLVTNDLEKEQAYVSVGFDAPLMADESRYAMEVLYAILSGQGGRLFYELRDKQSLAYSVYASSLLGLEASLFSIHIGTSPEKVEQALHGIYREVAKLHADGVTPEELERAKVYLMGNHDIGRRSTEAARCRLRSTSFMGLDSAGRWRIRTISRKFRAMM
ncbi:MAG: pitrilysin family protein [bacterium]